MPAPMRARHSQSPASRGVHHLALNTEDMKLTIDFYTRVLGMPLVHALRVPPGVGTGAGNRGNPPFENLRHYFFDAGGDCLVAFFELPAGAKPQADRNAVAAMQHCSFATTEAQFQVLHQRLLDEGVPVIGPIPVGAQTWSIYFFDPNGIRLEYSWQELDGEDVQVVQRWTQTAEEALAELRTLSDDPAWLDAVTRHLPTHR
ncbi:VOC family protein [Hydrogenophaga sp. OTU3427]|uniref:VOC family protein n=1 Tax=Hydrogenophaga sp. OTU3427 TaxID=3043856 RepID=UPI00313C0019